jgi:EAL domain-containing protein (putative c-di-GMP-specific phosphodiesterase class I)
LEELYALQILDTGPEHRFDGYTRLTGHFEDMKLVRSIVAKVHDLDLAVVAEGVETGQRLDFLRTTGCDQVQGS